jgi:RNA polymerase sigma-70 factor (ECF subfamily)
MALTPDEPQGTDGAFRTTHWTVVLQAAQSDAPDTTEAFARLYRDYWPPLYAFVRRRGYSPEEAEDITQGFFAQLLEKQSLNGLTREGGRFRSVLLAALTNCLANEWDRSRRQKRGGGQRLISLNAEDAEASLALEHPDQETPATLFDRQWAFVLLEHVLARLEGDYEANGHRELFQRLRVYLQGDRSGPSYAETAAQQGMSEGAVKVAVHRMRHRYGAMLREEIARTVASPDEVDAELQHLLSVLNR